MVEVRSRRLIAPVVLAATVVAGAASVALGASPWWDPPACADGPGALAAAAGDRPTTTDAFTPAPWYESTPTLDESGTLTDERVDIGVGPTRHRLQLPPESFVAGPFGRIVLVGADDGRRSRLQAIDIAADCAWPVADEADVIRRATISPDGTTLLQMRVDRATRADLGIWVQPLDGHLAPGPILAPIAPDGRFGRTWSTEFTWSVDGDRVAVQSCGLVACRTRLLDPSTAQADLVADPDLGPIVGLTRDRLVIYRACRGYPCPVISIDPATDARAVVTWAAEHAEVTGRGGSARIVHDWMDELGQPHQRSTDMDGADPVELDARSIDPRSFVPEVSR